MKIVRQGVILKTGRQRECVAFYRNILGLDVLFEDHFLTCFACGEGYLMVEPLLEGTEETPCGSFVLRFNVENIQDEQHRLQRHGVTSHYARFDWGEILTLADPAGTRIELKDAASFERQVGDIVGNPIRDLNR
jgi:catechol 2,3-dioxygenase-like lactoylglutathione lyase family enzyme